MTLWDAVRKRRKARQNVSSFAALIATPETGEFRMPQSGRLRLVSVAGASAGDTAATIIGPFPAYSEDEETGEIVRGPIGDRTIKTPVLAAGGSVVIDGLVARSLVTPASGFECYVDIGLGRWAQIASVA
jgi:hypothetical protein